MDENCIFCLIMSIALIGAAVFCLICLYKLAHFEDFFLKLRRRSFLKTLSRLGFNCTDSVELYEFFVTNCQLPLTNKQLRLLFHSIKEQNKYNKELSHEKKND